MSGLVGLWNTDGEPIDERVLRSMAEPLAHRGPDGLGVWIEGSVGLACQLHRVTPEAARETQPVLGAAGEALVFDGRLDNRQELISELRLVSAVSNVSPDAEIALAAYEQYGASFAARLGGDYSLAIFDPKARALVLARDPIGPKPLYYCQVRDSFLFATEIKALLRHPRFEPAPDDDALVAHFLLPGYQQDPVKTFFAGVHRLAPGHLAMVRRDGVAFERCWSFPRPPSRPQPFEECALEFRERFETAVKRRLRALEPTAVAVSGGLDSSSILAVGQDLCSRLGGPRVYGFYYGSQDGGLTDEGEFIRCLEAQCGVEIEGLTLGDIGYSAEALEQVRRVEAPIVTPLWPAAERLWMRARQRGAAVLLTGEGGDEVLCNRSYLFDLLRRGRWGMVFGHLRETPRWNTDIDPSCFVRAFLAEAMGCYLPRPVRSGFGLIRAAVRKSSGNGTAVGWYTKRMLARAVELSAGHRPARPSHQAGILAEAANQLRNLEWYDKHCSAHGLEARFPFLDRDLVAFLASVPGEIVCNQGVPRAILRDGLRGTLPAPIAERRWKGDYTRACNAGTARNAGGIIQYLKKNRMAVDRGYVDGDALERQAGVFAQCRDAGDTRFASSLGRALGLELFLDAFFGKRNPQREVLPHVG